jgi:hypothetical protein
MVCQRRGAGISFRDCKAEALRHEKLIWNCVAVGERALENSRQIPMMIVTNFMDFLSLR